MTDTPNTSPFGSYRTTDERIQELANRLHAWFISTDQLPELFEEALRKMTDALAEADDPMDAPADTLLKAFEDALGDFDNILSAFPQSFGDVDEQG
jgi:hypothetical protein